MPSSVTKKSKAKVRNKRIADKYQEWLDANPNAGRKRRINTFDAFADSVLLEETLSADKIS